MKGYLRKIIINIKNGQMAKKNIIITPKKNNCESFLKILWDEGFISGYRISPQNRNTLEIFLKYTGNGKPVIKTLNFFSKTNQKVYYSSKQMWKLDSSKLFIIFSTNRGLRSLNECKKHRIGGLLFFIIN